MSSEAIEAVRFYDYEPELGDLRREVLAGLHGSPKRLPPKLFYDERGSALFEQICELPEYYPTRTEMAILRERSSEIAELLGPSCLLIEYGSGNSRKVRLLLDALPEPAAYVAIDISREHLIEAAQRLARAYPAIEVIAVCADYTRPLAVPRPAGFDPRHQAVFFPGSTIGNFSVAQARGFLHTTAAQLRPGGSLILGVDLKKDARILNRAYNDSDGVTAAFNKNVLLRINREFGADFNLEAFRHQAFYNGEEGRVEMHLVSTIEQAVRVNSDVFQFRKGESIHTENSYKFSVEEFQSIARDAGFEPQQCWTDEAGLFSLHHLTAGG